MAPALRDRPDTLVLGAGGTLGIAWLRGVLAGLEESAGLDLRGCEHFVGTSAGAYVAASLAAGEAASASAEDPEQTPDVAGEFEAATDEHEVAGGDEDPGRGALRRATAAMAGAGTRLSGPVIPMALRATRPPGAVARKAALAVVPRGGRFEPADLQARAAALGDFDGRLQIVAVDRKRGSRVVFGAPGAPDARVGEAVLASCAVPWIFPPVEIGGREYVDGGVWSLSNLDVAPAGRGDRVLALLPTFRRARTGGGGGGLGLLRATAQGAGLAELQVLRNRGARTRIVAPDAASTEAIGRNPMDPSRREAVYAAGRAQGRRLAAG